MHPRRPLTFLGRIGQIRYNKPPLGADAAWLQSELSSAPISSTTPRMFFHSRTVPEHCLSLSLRTSPLTQASLHTPPLYIRQAGAGYRYFSSLPLHSVLCALTLPVHLGPQQTSTPFTHIAAPETRLLAAITALKPQPAHADSLQLICYRSAPCTPAKLRETLAV